MKNLTVALLILTLLGCYNSRKAGEQVGKAMTTYPAQTATQLRDRWPCITTASDTIRRTDTIENIISVTCDTTFVTDTVNNTVVRVQPGKTVKVPCNTITKTEIVIQKIKDSADIYLMQIQIDKLQQTITNKDATIDEQQKKIARRGKWNLWLLIITVASIFLNYIQFRKR